MLIAPFVVFNFGVNVLLVLVFVINFKEFYVIVLRMPYAQWATSFNVYHIPTFIVN